MPYAKYFLKNIIFKGFNIETEKRKNKRKRPEA
jgi:hypothetical protein